MKRFLLSSFLLSGLASLGHAQSFFTPTSQYLTPGFRGAGTEFSHWDVFYSAYNGINYPDMAAPNGGVGGQPVPASTAGFTAPAGSDPLDPYAFWSLSNPTLKQTGTDSAFIIGSGSAGNIYSFAAATTYEVADSTPYTAGTVVAQFQTDGQLMNLATVRLIANGTTYLPTNFLTEYKVSGSAMGGTPNRTAAQWNLTGLNITDYVIKFEATGSSNSFQELLLDTAPTYSEAVPSARTWSSASGNFSDNTKWQTATLPASGGNLAITGGSSLTVDGSTRTLGELQLSAAGSFALGASGGGKLKINTGISATPSSASVYNITAPIDMGAYNLWKIGANADVTLSGVVGGNVGFDKSGAGTLRLTNNNTFTGPVTVEDGVVELSGLNTYTGSTSILGGSLVLRQNAPTSGSGSLGPSSAVKLGSGGTFNTPASLVIDGPFTVTQGITIVAGADPKTLAARNTGAGAAFTGGLALNSQANNVRFTAEAATDVLTLSGPISGGLASGTITKQGLGLVVLAGSNTRNYLNNTIVQSGTLEIGNGATLSGPGDVRVAAGAKLVVSGSLAGTGTLVGDGGTITGSGTITRALTLGNGSVLAPGNTVGTLSTGAETWSSSHLQLDLTDATGTEGVGRDFINVTGALSLTSTVNAFTLDLRTLFGGSAGLMANFNANQPYSWRFATASDGITGFSADAFAINSAGFLNNFGTGYFSVSMAGHDLFLNYIPEPSAAALLLTTGSLLLARRRRR